MTTSGSEPTEQALIFRRLGQTQAERLCAGLLLVDGYREVDPQAPLGGPDGLKDVICTRGGRKFVAAVYFPSTAKRFSQIKQKFIDDFAGVDANGADGIVFFTNRHLKQADREKLRAIAAAANKTAEIYHSERIRVLLDSPMGYGLRLEFLGIQMSEADQLAFWSRWKGDLAEAIRQQGSDFVALRDRVDGYISERLKSVTNVQGELAFIFGILCYGIPLFADALPGTKAIENYIRRCRSFADTNANDLIEYLRNDPDMSDDDRQLGIDNVTTWVEVTRSAGRLVLGDGPEKSSPIERVFDSLMKSVGRGPQDAEAIEKAFKADLMEAFVQEQQLALVPTAKLELFQTLITMANDQIEAAKANDPTSPLATMDPMKPWQPRGKTS